MRRVVPDVADFQGHLPGQLLLNGKVPFLNHGIPEIGRDERNCSDVTGNVVKTVVG